MQKTSLDIDKYHRCIVDVSEYKLEYDFFFQIPPDDERKRQRKLILAFNLAKGVSVVNLEYMNLDSVEKKLLIRTRESCDIDEVKITLPDSNETEARRLFAMYHQEIWNIDNGLLCQHLEEVEEDIQKKRYQVEGGIENEQVEEDAEIKDDFITEDELWETRFFYED